METIKGKPGEPLTVVRARAKQRLIEVRDNMGKGQYVELSTITVEMYVASWLEAPAGLSPKTVERYRQLATQQIYPHLGAVPLQKLGPAHIQDWHGVLLARGGKGGRPLSARTVGHAHRLLHRALARAVEGQVAFRNVAGVVKPPKVEEREMAILTSAQIGDVFAELEGDAFYSIVVVALGTGLRRGELLALRWSRVDLETGSLRVEESIEETEAGLRFKPPKTKRGRRNVSLSPTVVEALRTHRKAQLELRLALGLGKPANDALVFCESTSGPMSPDKLSRDWSRLVVARKLPKIPFHALRHTHVSALIDGGLDVVTVSQRIGHSSPAFTLKTYAHMFSRKDEVAAEAIEAALTR